MRPSLRTTMRSATSIASSWSWVTRTVVTWTSSCSRRSHARRSARTLASRAPNGSSSRSTRGSMGTARARAIRWRAPRHPLARAAAELAGIARLVAAKPDDAEQLVDLRGNLGLRALADAQPEGDVLAHGHVLERRVVLEDEADAAALRGQGRGVLVGDDDAPGVGQLEAGDHAQQRRLARAAGPEQRSERAVLHVEGDVVERAELPELLRHAVNRDHPWSFRGLSRVMASNVAMAMTPSRAEAA